MPRALRRFWRSFRADPWYAVSVVVTIGLGIGISTSAFTVLDRLVLRSPPGVHAPRELQRILITELSSPAQPKTVERNSFSYPGIRVIVQATTGLGEVASYWTWPDKIPIRLNTEVRSARVLGVSTNYFSVLGVTPALGRTFSVPSALVAPQGGPAEVVISEAFWIRALGRRPDALGASVDLHHVPLKVVGIAPAGFDGIGLDGPDIWVPAEFVGPESYGPKWKEDPNGTVWAVVLRKSPDGTRGGHQAAGSGGHAGPRGGFGAKAQDRPHCPLVAAALARLRLSEGDSLGAGALGGVAGCAGHDRY